MRKLKFQMQVTLDGFVAGPNGEMDTEHSTYPVPLMIIGNQFAGRSIVLPKGKLGDVAPTILTILGYPVPAVMTGNNLVVDLK